MASTYTVRITNSEGKIIAWIDKDLNICIEQPNHPNLLSTGENWATEEDALAWAEQEAASLTQASIDYDNELIAKAEKEAQEAAAREALISSAAKLDEIHAMLTQLTNN